MGRFYRDILGDWEKNRSSSMGDCTFYEEDDIDIHSLPFLQIYSCHDTSLIPVMCGFGLYDGKYFYSRMIWGFQVSFFVFF